MKNEILIILFFLLLSPFARAQVEQPEVVTERSYIRLPLLPAHNESGDQHAYFLNAVTQTIELSSGWNWFSTYIEMDPIALLEALEAQLGENGLQIVSKGKVTSYDEDEEEWGGGLQSIGITNGNTYMIEIDATITSVTVTLEGPASVPGDYTITINKGWNWIGFPCAEQVAINVALAGFEAEPDDEIVSKGKASSYDADEEEWGGSLQFLKPGEGYMYNSNSNETKTLTIQTGGIR